MGKEFQRNECTWSFVGLSLAGKRLDPDRITEVLGIQPDSWGKLGLPTSSGKACKRGFWKLGCSKPSLSLDKQIEAVLKRVASVRDRVGQLIREDETIAEAYLAITLELPPGRPAVGYFLESALIGDFIAMGMDLVFSVYLPVEEPPNIEEPKEWSCDI
jgi:hypothetical protein